MKQSEIIDEAIAEGYKKCETKCIGEILYACAKKAIQLKTEQCIKDIEEAAPSPYYNWIQKLIKRWRDGK